MTFSVEVVTHCLSGPNGQYAKLLAWQIHSLLDHPPQNCEVVLSVCYADGDDATLHVLQSAVHSELWLTVHPRKLPANLLMQRPIGRHLCAKTTKADVVWMVDVDYLPLAGCLDSLSQVLDRPERLFFPRQTLISRDHATGDAYLARDPASGIDPADFVPKIERKAIGGIQIVRGDTAREHGYCGHLAKYQRPAPDDCQTIIGFGADAAYRRQLGTPGTPIDVPNLYRLRHSVTGDDRAERAGIVLPREEYCKEGSATATPKPLPHRFAVEHDRAD